MTDIKSFWSEEKRRAVAYLEDAYHKGFSDYFTQFETIRDRLVDIPSRYEIDHELEAMWDMLMQIPVDSETDTITADFLDWPQGTRMQELCRWFDERCSHGVMWLMYGYTDAMEKYLASARNPVVTGAFILCNDTDCAYNHSGRCRYAAVNERMPAVNIRDSITATCSSKISRSWFNHALEVEIPFRLTEILGVKADQINNDLISQCIERVEYDNSFINFDGLDNTLRQVLEDNEIEYEE